MARKIRGFKAIADVLDAEDVDTVFTFMSEDIMRMISTIADDHGDGVDVVHTRHEQAAVGMADGYARASDQIGVCIVGKGPAIAQTGTALVGARKRGSSLLVIVPESPLSRMEGSACKRFRQESFLHATIGGTAVDANRYGNTDSIVTVRSGDTLVTDIREVFRRLRTGEGPIVVQVSADVLNGRVEIPEPARERRYSPALNDESGPKVHPSQVSTTDAVELYLDSDATKPPVIIAGMGAVAAGAREEIVELAERTGALLATTLQARGYLSNHPFSLGFVGDFGATVANEYLIESDYVLAVGCTLNRYTTDAGYLLGGEDDESKIVHVDTDPNAIGRYTPVDIGIVGDAAVTVSRLVEELERRGIDREREFWTDRVRSRIEEFPRWKDEAFIKDGDGIDPRQVVTAIDDALPDDRLVLTDPGHHGRWVIDAIEVPHVGDFIWTVDFSAIGQSLPVGVGAATATETRTCITFCGDGGFMMALPEVETAVRNKIPIVIVVVNDSSLGSEYHRLVSTGDYPGVAAIDTPDIAKIAENLGAVGHRITNEAELEAFVEEIGDLDNRPIVADCRVNREIRHPSYG